MLTFVANLMRWLPECLHRPLHSEQWRQPVAKQKETTQPTVEEQQAVALAELDRTRKEVDSLSRQAAAQGRKAKDMQAKYATTCDALDKAAEATQEANEVWMALQSTSAATEEAPQHAGHGTVADAFTAIDTTVSKADPGDWGATSSEELQRAWRRIEGIARAAVGTGQPAGGSNDAETAAPTPPAAAEVARPEVRGGEANTKDTADEPEATAMVEDDGAAAMETNAARERDSEEATLYQQASQEKAKAEARCGKRQAKVAALAPEATGDVTAQPS